MIIHCSNFRLRPWQEGDAFSLSENANNKKIWNHLRNAFPHPYTQKDAASWIALQKEEAVVHNFAIEVAGKAVGGIGLIPKSDIYSISAEMGYWLGENYWGRGIISEAIPEVVHYGFEKLGLVKIFAQVFDFNVASMRVLQKAGFVKEAVLKKGAIKNGIIIDEHYFAKWNDKKMMAI